MTFLKRKSVAIILIAIVALSAGAVAIYSSKSTAQASVPAARPALTVSTALPQPLDLPIKLSANGNISAWQEAIIGSEANGLRLLQVLVNVGDQVKAGQVLAVFAGDSVQAEVAQARASLLEARANALEAADNAARARTLDSSGALSAQQINQYNTAEQTAQARAEAAKAVLDAQLLRGHQTRVLAPDSGVISARSATVGAVLPAGTELFRLIRGGRLEWRAEVTSAEMGRLQPGTPVSVTAASGAQLKGKVRMVAPSVDPQTRTGLVYVDLPAAATMTSPAKAGMFAKGEFELGATPALTVPQTALVIRDGFNYVFRLNADQRISQLKVQTGRLAGDRVEISAGLDANARIIINGAGFLNDGDLVRVSDDLASNKPLAPDSTAAEAIK
ncbi:RND family efflux transporter, MFP subunit [Polaromonas sp. OV174]|uniref:efflux RND transporter periplasmic adaptor subunit n=1 Tax=Polaromonas sp. OV174 TaxID=1855300 RepID=UPI0008E7D954|nr:efflux RND transporter periplasmic adaptor subunit [Polaromonas sp. OV174]SFC29870.1 RND family efflux transporter, MFP subunit [Polaromonas sp. OV174]